ncbi:hypothetical protein SAMN05444505_11626 [Pseudomonas syringae]|uniref:DUF1534 domain-containing protein n=1 Tax=Pseudomonas syringae TaxID=317 RepID=A0AB37ZUR3_PSESX|nr:hypothetical protein SAMN05444505_11626 [Pseudomonas syringae]
MIAVLLSPMRLVRRLQLRFRHITRPTGPRERLLRRCRGHRLATRMSKLAVSLSQLVSRFVV